MLLFLPAPGGLNLKLILPLTLLALLLAAGAAAALPQTVDAVADASPVEEVSPAGLADGAAVVNGAPPLVDAVVPMVAAVPSSHAPEAPAVPLVHVVTRHYVIIDVARAAAARGTPVDESAFGDAMPRYVPVGTVDLAPEARRIVEEAQVEPARTDRRPTDATTQAAAATPAAGLEAAAVAVLLVAGLATQAAVHGVVGMYHRIAPAKALENPTRRDVHAAVTECGAAGIADVARTLDVHPKTVKYHLDLLVKFQLLVRDDDGIYRPPGLRREPDAPVEDTILDLVETRPGINMTEVARALDMSKSAAQQKVTALLVEGRLQSRRASRARLLYPAAASA